MERSAATSEQIVEQARHAMRTRDFDLARRLLDFVVRTDPSNSDAVQLLASMPRDNRLVGAQAHDPGYDYAYRIAQDAAIFEYQRLGMTPPVPETPQSRRWKVTRLWLTVVLVALIPLGFRAAWIDFRATLHQQDVNQAQFAMSPGCVATSTNVDAKLPPCTLMAATIVSKTTNTRPSESYGHVTDYNLSVRETTTGTTHEYRQVSASFWGEVSVGQQVSIKQWRGQQVELDAGTENIDLTTFIGDARGTFERAVAWFIAATGSMAALQLLWWRPRRRRPIQLF